MAKRRRLTPAQVDYLAPHPAQDPAPLPTTSAALRAPEVKSSFPPLPMAPIAQVAGDAAAAAGLREVAAELTAARSEGRLVLRLPLGAIDAGHLVRDRLALDDAEMTALCDSIRARGQQTPIEVVDLGRHSDPPHSDPRQTGAAPRYGLISGWRRLSALHRLAAEPDGDRFGSVLALLRRPEAAADAYLAMVEENEVRVGLSYYERARIAARAAALGVHPSPQAAIRALFPTASRAKRSKIGSFLAIHEALDGTLRFAAAIPERLGLALSHALEADPTLAPRLATALQTTPPATEAQELAILTRALLPARSSPFPDAAAPASEAGEEITPGLWLKVAHGAGGLRLTLWGPAVDAGFTDRLKDHLKQAPQP